MKRNVILTVIGCLMSVMAWGEQVVVETKNMTMVLDVEQGKHPQYVYFGSKLNAEELAHLQKPVEGRMDAYPAYGLNTPAEAAFAMRHADGNLSSALYADDVSRNGDVTTIRLKDPVYPITVNLK